MKIAGKVVLITGGASGLGKALALRLLENDAKFVALLDLNKENGEKVCSEYSQKFGADRVKFIQCDVTDQNQMKQAYQQAYDVNQTLDVVFNNAGLISKSDRKNIDVNLIAVLNGTILAHELLTKAKRTEKAVIVNTGSMAGLNASPVCNISYSAAKHGVVGLTKAYPVSTDAFSKDTRAVCVCPAAVNTPFWTENTDYRTGEIDAKLEKWKHTYVTETMVVDAFIRAVEDDQLNGNLLLVKATGTEVV